MPNEAIVADLRKEMDNFLRKKPSVAEHLKRVEAVQKMLRQSRLIVGSRVVMRELSAASTAEVCPDAQLSPTDH